MSLEQAPNSTTISTSSGHLPEHPQGENHGPEASKTAEVTSSYWDSIGYGFSAAASYVPGASYMLGCEQVQIQENPVEKEEEPSESSDGMFAIDLNEEVINDNETAEILDATIKSLLKNEELSPKTLAEQFNVTLAKVAELRREVLLEKASETQARNKSLQAHFDNVRMPNHSVFSMHSAQIGLIKEALKLQQDHPQEFEAFFANEMHKRDLLDEAIRSTYATFKKDPDKTAQLDAMLIFLYSFQKPAVSQDILHETISNILRNPEANLEEVAQMFHMDLEQVKSLQYAALQEREASIASRKTAMTEAFEQASAHYFLYDSHKVQLAKVALQFRKDYPEEFGAFLQASPLFNASSTWSPFGGRSYGQVHKAMVNIDDFQSALVTHQSDLFFTNEQDPLAGPLWQELENLKAQLATLLPAPTARRF